MHMLGMFIWEPGVVLDGSCGRTEDGVELVGQFLNTVQLGRCTKRSASRFHLELIARICPSGEKTRLLVGVVK